MNKKEKERTGFIVRNIKTEKRDAQNGGADKMGNVKMISPAVPNMPWQERSEKIVNAPVWRYKENPIIGRNPVEGVARIFNSAVIPYEGNSSAYSVGSRRMESRMFTWEEARMVFIGILTKTRYVLWMKKAMILCRYMRMIQGL